MNTIAFILFLSAAFIAACGSTQLSTKESSEFNSGKKAMLQTYNQPLLGALIFDEQPITQIIAVDSTKLDSVIFKTDERVAVAVGLRKIELSCVSRSGPDERDYSEVVELEIKPFHEYQLRCSFDTEFGPDGSYKGSFSIKETRIK